MDMYSWTLIWLFGMAGHKVNFEVVAFKQESTQKIWLVRTYLDPPFRDTTAAIDLFLPFLGVEGEEAGR